MYVPIARNLRGPRAAAALLFFVTGAVFATWAARIPSIQARLGLTPTTLSVALIAIEAGALAGLTAGGRVVANVGSAPALRIGFAAFPPALAAAALAPTLPLLATALVVMGASNSLIDVALNAQGIELERRARRPVLCGLHSGHSFGVLAGGLIGTLLAARGVPTSAHFVVAAALAIAVAQGATTALVREPPHARRSNATSHAADRGAGEPPHAKRNDATPPADRGAARRALATIGLLAFCAFFVEGAANDWSAVDAGSTHGAGPALAAGAFTAFSLTLACGRLGGDHIVARYGRARSLRAAGLVAAVGAALVVAAPSAQAALGAWALLGAGVATIAPTLLGAAPSLASAPPAVAVAAVSRIGYSGSFVGPPVIGVLAGLTNLSAALGCLILGAAAIAVLAHRPFRPQHRPPRPDCAHFSAVLRSAQRTTCPQGGETPANQPFL
jgi:MFS family permease